MPQAMEWSFATPKMSALRPSSMPIGDVPPLRPIACTGWRVRLGTPDPCRQVGSVSRRCPRRQGVGADWTTHPVELDRALPDRDRDACAHRGSGPGRW